MFSRARALQNRVAGILLLVGVVCYILPSALHGNPPIVDAAATLDYVAGRDWWTSVHFLNIAAVVMWAAAVTLLHTSGRLAVGRGAVARTTWSIASGAFAIYFGIHAIGLWSAAEQFGSVPEATVVERTESVLLVLGSAAFVAQALLGTAVAALGMAVISSKPSTRILGGVGVVAGAGWAAGAMMINFGVIVPFTALSWAWVIALAVTVLKTARREQNDGAPIAAPAGR